MVLGIEGILNAGVQEEKPLRRSGALEPLHLAFSSPRWLTRILRPVVAPSAAVMAAPEPKITDVRAQIVSGQPCASVSMPPSCSDGSGSARRALRPRASGNSALRPAEESVRSFAKPHDIEHAVSLVLATLGLQPSTAVMTRDWVMIVEADILVRHPLAEFLRNAFRRYDFERLDITTGVNYSLGEAKAYNRLNRRMS